MAADGIPEVDLDDLLDSLTPEEDAQLTELVPQYTVAKGVKWTEISRDHMPSRTPNMLRNYWYRQMKAAQENMLALLAEDEGTGNAGTGNEGTGKKVNLCQRCGEPKRGHVCPMQAQSSPEPTGSAAIAADSARTIDEHTQ